MVFDYVNLKMSVLQSALFLVLILLVSTPVLATTNITSSFNFSKDLFDAVDYTRGSIESDKPIDWTVFLVDELDLFRIKYSTPAISIQEFTVLNETAVSKKIVFTTNYSKGYEDVDYQMIIPVNVENITLLNANIINYTNGSLRFSIPFVNTTVAVYFSAQKTAHYPFLFFSNFSYSSKNAVTSLGNFSLMSPLGSVESFSVSEDLDIEFKITNITPGSLVPVTLQLPFSISPNDYLYLWKNVSGTLHELPYTLDDSRSQLTLYLKDGYLDDDGLVNGEIIDPLKLRPNLNLTVEDISTTRKDVVVNNKQLQMDISAGDFDTFYVLDPEQIPNVPVLPEQLPYNLIKFNVTNVTDSILVNITVENLTSNFLVRKFNPNTLDWYAFDYQVVAENTIQIKLVDGGAGDDDGIKNGVIHDDLGLVFIDLEQAMIYDSNDLPKQNITAQVLVEDTVTVSVHPDDYVSLLFESEASELNFIYVVAEANQTTQLDLFMSNGTLLDSQDVLGKERYVFSLSGLENVTSDKFTLVANDSITYDYITDPTEYTFIGNITQQIDKGGIETGSLRYPSVQYVSGDIFVFAGLYNGEDCVVQTLNVSTNGTINQVNVDKTTIISGTCNEYPELRPLTGTSFVVVTADANYNLTVSVVNISTTGIVTLTNQRLFSGINTFRADVEKLNDSLILIAGENNQGDIRMHTLEVFANGTIGDIIDTEETNSASNLYQPDLLLLHNDIAVVAETGAGNDGFIRTFQVHANGTIDTQIDVLEYDTATGIDPSLINISDSMVAIVSRGAGNDGFMDTVNISINGTISAVIDSVEFDPSSGSYFDVISLAPETVTIGYSGAANDGFMEVMEVFTNGTIGTELSRDEYEPTDTFEHDFVKLSSTRTLLLSFQSGNGGVYATTTEYAANGSITTAITDEQFISGASASLLKSAKLSDTRIIATYRGFNSDGYVKTFDVTSGGIVSNNLSNFIFETTAILDPSIAVLNETNVIIAYQGGGNDGWMVSLKIAPDGSVTQLDKVEYDNVEGRDPYVLRIDADTIAVADYDSLSGGNYDSRVRTYTINSDGTIVTPEVDELFILNFALYDSQMIWLNETYYVLATRLNGNDGMLFTLDIQPNGSLGTQTVANITFDLVDAYDPSLVRLAADEIAVAYRGQNADGFILTYNTGVNASTFSLNDYYEFDTSNGYYPYLFPIRGDRYGISYSSTGLIGTIKTLNITSTGTIDTSFEDTFFFSSAAVNFPVTYHMQNDVFANTFYDASGNGFLQTLDINYNNVLEVNLTSPTPYEVISSTNNISFTVDAVDDFSIASCTLYHNISGSFIANETHALTGTTNTTSYLMSLVADGDYIWNTYCCDGDGECAFAPTNSSFSVTYVASATDTQAPNVSNIAVVAGTQVNISTPTIFTCAANDTIAVENVSLFITNSTNESLSHYQTIAASGIATEVNFSVTLNEFGNYSYQCQARDPSNNLNATAPVVGFSVVQPTVLLTACAVLDKSYVIYELQNNVTSTGTCFTIVGSEINFKGNGFEINFASTTNSSKGIYVVNSSAVDISNVSIYADFDPNDVSLSSGYVVENSVNISFSNANITLLGRNPTLSSGQSTNSFVLRYQNVSSSFVTHVSIDHLNDELHYGLYINESSNNDFSNINYTFNYRRAGALYELAGTNNTYTNISIVDDNLVTYNDDFITVYIADSNRTSFDNVFVNTSGSTRQMTSLTTTTYDVYQPVFFQNVIDASISDLEIHSDHNAAVLVEGSLDSHFNFSVSGTNSINGAPLLWYTNVQNTAIPADGAGQVILANSYNVTLSSANISNAGLAILNTDVVHITNFTINQTVGVPLNYLYKSSQITYDTGSIVLDVPAQGTTRDELFFIYETDAVTFTTIALNTTRNMDHYFDVRYVTGFTVDGFVSDGLSEAFNLFTVNNMDLANLEFNNMLDVTNEETFFINEVFDVTIDNITAVHPGGRRSPLFYFTGNANNWVVSNFYLENNDTGTGEIATNAPHPVIFNADRFYDIVFINGTLASTNYPEIFVNSNVDANSNVTLQSVIMPDAGANITASDFVIYRDWVLTAQVNDSLTNTSLALATTTINDTTGNLIHEEVSDATGLVSTVVREYTQDSVGFNYSGFNNYSIRITKDFTNFTTVNVSDDVVVPISIPAVDYPPAVALVSPVNTTEFVSFLANITLSASITDDVNVTNCTLYHNASGSWIANQTNFDVGKTVTSNFTLLNLSTTKVVWNVNCFDTAGNSSFAPENYTFTVTNPNTPPTQANPILVATSEDILNSDDLLCTNSSTNDVDGDIVQNNVIWYLSGESYAYASYPLAALSNATHIQDVYGVHDGLISGAVMNLSLDNYGALSFDGVNDVVDLGNLDYISSGVDGEYTIFMRVYFDQVNTRALIGDEVATNGGVLFQTSSSGQLQTYVANNYRTSSYVVSPGKWYDLVFRQDENSIDLFVNGSFEQTITAFLHDETADSTYIGAYDANQRDFAGAIAEVIIYPLSISDEQVYALSHATDTLVSQETNPAETWSCAILPFDGEDAAPIKYSNNVTVEADYDFVVLSVTANDTVYLEDQNYTVVGLINNTGKVNSTNVNLTFTVEQYNGSWLAVSETNFSVADWEINTSVSFNISTRVPVGITRVTVDVDTDNAFIETLEADNTLATNISVSGWAYFFGNISNSYVGLRASSNVTFREWFALPEGYLLYSDSEANYYPFNLGVFTELDDFNESEAVLNLTSVGDSLTYLFDADDNGVADMTINLEIAGQDLTIPVASSTNTSSFYTGILFDTADGAVYNGTQDLVFIGIINASQTGAYGTYDYEVRIPYTLGTQTGVIDNIDSYFAIT